MTLSAEILYHSKFEGHSSQDLKFDWLLHGMITLDVEKIDTWTLNFEELKKHITLKVG